ncbi:PD-(D/E)XK nuclease family transposase [Thiocapsa sp.]|uniref:PD-(D/E)XK nuclease family transposase n=1 Tax=Thiocapsa sp. TaxID=2024551 RepID=UPI0035945D5A
MDRQLPGHWTPAGSEPTPELGSRLVNAPPDQYTPRMRRPIDPKVDCVFKTLFGSGDHRDLLIHFLNALLAEDLAAPITAVDILTPATSARPSTTS